MQIVEVHPIDSINRKQLIIDAVMQRRRLNHMSTVTSEVFVVPSVKKLFPNKAAYLAMRAHWARNCKGSSTTQILMYNLLRGVEPRRGFTAATNKNKLENGYQPDRSFELAKGWIKYFIGERLNKAEEVDYWTKKKNGVLVDEYLSIWFGQTVTRDIVLEALKAI